MVRKLIFMSVILVTVFLIWFFNTKENSIQDQQLQEEQVQEHQVEKLLIPTENNKKTTLAVSKKTTNEGAKTTAENELDTLLVAISDRQFSDDPVVELESLMLANMFCLDDYSAQTYFIGKLSIKAQQQISQAQSGCDEFRSRYPILNNSVKISAFLTELQPSSSYGMLREKQPSEYYPDYTMDLYFSSLETKSGPLITYIGSVMNLGMAFENVHRLAQMLKTEDKMYLNSVVALATRKLSCAYQDGISCSANSYFMLEQCVKDDSFCGMNFETWFEQVTLPGQRRDVEIVLDYLKQVSQ